MQLLAVIVRKCCIYILYKHVYVHGDRNEVVIIIQPQWYQPCELLTLKGRVLHGLCVLLWSLPPQTGSTPLFMASQNGYLPVVQTLIQHGAKVDLAMNVSHCSLTVQ